MIERSALRLFADICRAETPDELLAVARQVEAGHLLSAGGARQAADLLAGDRPVVLFGAGRFAKSMLTHWASRGLRPAYCVDSNPRLWGGSLLDLPIVAPQTLYEQTPAPLVVTAAMICGGIEAELAAHGLPSLFAEWDGQVGYLPGSHLLGAGPELERAWQALADDASRRVLLAACKARLFQAMHFEMIGSPFLHQVASAPQYFVADLLEFVGGETWVDCGAYDGDLLVSGHAFLLAHGRATPRVHAFEADASNLARLRRTVQDFGLPGVTLHHALVGGEDGWCADPDFNACRPGATASEPVRQVRLDSVLAEEPVHFVKMDIEGTKSQALAVAAHLIDAWRPKLAVCVYHETRHLLEIPLSIRQRHPEYRLYLRHHSSNTLWETVCYAAPG